MIYLDNNATTRVAPEVFEAMKPYLTEAFGNPSSAHTLGRNMRVAVESAREQVAGLLGARHADEIVFTSCGSESDNWAIRGVLEANPDRRHIITTGVEHEAVRNLCEHFAKIGYEVSWLEVDGQGELDLEKLRSALRPDTAIVSIMLANNETGVLFPVEAAADLVREKSRAVFHVDGVQAIGKIPIALARTSIDLFSLSGHKFHAPKGIGALYVRRGVILSPFIVGGGQESGRRSGTEAVPNIVALGAAADLVSDFSHAEEVRALRDEFEDRTLADFPIARLNGSRDRDQRLPNTSNISFVGNDGSTMVRELDTAGICVSTGSACHSESKEVSGVLRAMNVPFEIAHGAIRFSFGRYNVAGDVERTLSALAHTLAHTTY